MQGSRADAGVPFTDVGSLGEAVQVAKGLLSVLVSHL